MLLLDRILLKIKIPDDNTRCWDFDGVKKDTGYSQLNINKKPVRAHRLVYEIFKGKIPDGLCLDHLCRNRWCVNPNHLEPVTIEENKKRGFSPCANNARKTHCVHGHEFSKANTSFLNRGGRRCKKCHVIQEQNRRKRKNKK